VEPTVQLWEESEGRWRWRYKDGDLEILSNHPYPRRHDAEHAASLAYPDVPMAWSSSRAVPDSNEQRPSFAAFVLTVVALWRWYRRGR
jgi:hypothetical protein